MSRSRSEALAFCLFRDASKESSISLLPCRACASFETAPRALGDRPLRDDPPHLACQHAADAPSPRRSTPRALSAPTPTRVRHGRAEPLRDDPPPSRLGPACRRLAFAPFVPRLPPPRAGEAGA